MSASTDLPRFLSCADLVGCFPRDHAGKPLVSERTIQRWAAQKKIPGALRFGRRWFFQQMPVRQWIEGGGVLRLMQGAA